MDATHTQCANSVQRARFPRAAHERTSPARRLDVEWQLFLAGSLPGQRQAEHEHEGTQRHDDAFRRVRPTPEDSGDGHVGSTQDDDALAHASMEGEDLPILSLSQRAYLCEAHRGLCDGEEDHQVADVHVSQSYGRLPLLLLEVVAKELLHRQVRHEDAEVACYSTDTCKAHEHAMYSPLLPSSFEREATVDEA